VSVAADNMIEPKSGMVVGETFFSEPKGKEEKKETKENDKVVVIGVNKGRSKSKGKAKGYAFIARKMDNGREIILSIRHSNIQVKVFF
jgi:hypothetical protein